MSSNKALVLGTGKPPIQWIEEETVLIGRAKSPDGILEIQAEYEDASRSLSWRFSTLQGILLGVGTQDGFRTKNEALLRAEKILTSEIANSLHVKWRRKMDGWESIH